MAKAKSTMKAQRQHYAYALTGKLPKQPAKTPSVPLKRGGKARGK